MSRTIPQCDIWQSTGGNWYVAYTKSFSKNRDNWLIPARAMNMPPADWLEWLISNFHPDNVHIREDGKFVSFYWKKQNDANNYKLYINKILRAKKFYLD